MRVAGACYLISAGVGTWLAVRDDLPVSFAGWDLASDSVVRDFVSGGGTALSAPFALLVLLAILLVLAGRADGLGRVSLILLAVLAVGFVVGALGEPVTREALRSPSAHADRTLIVVANVVIPVALFAATLRALRRHLSVGEHGSDMSR